MSPEIIVAFISGFGGVIASVIAAFQAIKIKRIESEKTIVKTAISGLVDEVEHKTRLQAIDYILDFDVFNRLVSTINDIFENTTIDRFLIFYGTNGVQPINTVSVVFQMESSQWRIDALTKYKELTVDQHYKEMLGFIEKNEMILLHADTMEECLLRDLYAAEGVKHSIVKFLSRKHLTPTQDLVLYCSLASHSDAEIKPCEISYIKAKFGVVKKMIERLSD